MKSNIYIKTVRLVVLSIFLLGGVIALYAIAPNEKDTLSKQSIAVPPEIENSFDPKKPDNTVILTIPDKIRIGKKSSWPGITESAPAGPHPMLSELFLRGIANYGMENAIAIIENKGTQKFYEVGDTIEDGTLIKIFERSVLICIDDKEVMLKIAFSSIRDDGNGMQATISRHDWDRSLADLSSLISQIDVKPFTVEDGGVGLKVSGIRPGSLPDNLGFRDGDIIQEINGVKIKKPGMLSTLYQGMKYVPLDFLPFEDPVEIIGNRFLSLNKRANGIIHEISKVYRKIQSSKEIPISFWRDGKQEIINFSVDEI